MGFLDILRNDDCCKYCGASPYAPGRDHHSTTCRIQLYTSPDTSTDVPSWFKLSSDCNCFANSFSSGSHHAMSCPLFRRSTHSSDTWFEEHGELRALESRIRNSNINYAERMQDLTRAQFLGTTALRDPALRLRYGK